MMNRARRETIQPWQRKISSRRAFGPAFARRRPPAPVLSSRPTSSLLRKVRRLRACHYYCRNKSDDDAAAAASPPGLLARSLFHHWPRIRRAYLGVAFVRTEAPPSHGAAAKRRRHRGGAAITAACPLDQGPSVGIGRWSSGRESRGRTPERTSSAGG